MNATKDSQRARLGNALHGFVSNFVAVHGLTNFIFHNLFPADTLEHTRSRFSADGTAIAVMLELGLEPTFKSQETVVPYFFVLLSMNGLSLTTLAGVERKPRSRYPSQLLPP